MTAHILDLVNAQSMYSLSTLTVLLFRVNLHSVGAAKPFINVHFGEEKTTLKKDTFLSWKTYLVKFSINLLFDKQA